MRYPTPEQIEERDRAAEYVAGLTPEQFAAFAAATRPPDDWDALEDHSGCSDRAGEELPPSGPTGKLVASIVLARRARNWNQGDLADAVGVSRSVIANLESGRMKSASLELAVNLAAAIDVPLSELIGDGLNGQTSARWKIEAIRRILSD